MKTFKELKIGDYIFCTCDELPGLVDVRRIEDISEFYNETIFDICWFGEQAKYTKSKLTIKTEDLDKTKILYEQYGHGKFYCLSEYEIENKGVGHYIYNKAKDIEHREYELVQDNLLFKDNVYIEQALDGYGSVLLNKTNEFKWNNPSDLVLYKALYDNPDGPFFVRHADDFYKNFTRIY